MENITLDLTRPDHAYFFGFMQGDGTLYQSKRNPNKGKLAADLSIRDQDIVFRFKAMFPQSTITYRRRATNFAEDYQSIVWSMCQQNFREDIEACGLPVGNKSLIVKPPEVPYSVIDYWRGLVDADGSLGWTKAGLCFLSLVTTSEVMARAFEAFLATLTSKMKHTQRNTRDKAFNIMVTREDAQIVASTLYYGDCLALDRKVAKASEVMTWVRRAGSRRISQKKWTLEQDAILRTLTPNQAAEKLGRTQSSVKNRKERLRRAAKQTLLKLKDGDQSAEGAA